MNQFTTFWSFHTAWAESGRSGLLWKSHFIQHLLPAWGYVVVQKAAPLSTSTSPLRALHRFYPTIEGSVDFSHLGVNHGKIEGTAAANPGFLTFGI